MKRTFGVTMLALLASSVSFAAMAQSGQLRLGVEVPTSVVNVPMLMTIDRLQEAGYDVSMVNFQSPETMTLALQNGEVEMIGISVGTVFSAVEAGLEAKLMLGLAKSDFHMVALAEIESCADLDGRSVAIHSYEGTTGAMTTYWLGNECPEAQPNIMIVPGSENRLAGLLAGQLDASPIDTQSALQLMEMRPGVFDFIESFSDDALLASGYVANDSWMDANEELATELARIYLEVVDEIDADPQILVEETMARIPDVERDVIEQVVPVWIEQEIFVPAWGVDPEIIEQAIAFYELARPFDNVNAAEDVSTDRFIQAAQ